MSNRPIQDVPTLDELLKINQEKHQRAIAEAKRKQEERKIAIIKHILDEEERVRNQQKKQLTRGRLSNSRLNESHYNLTRKGLSPGLLGKESSQSLPTHGSSVSSVMETSNPITTPLDWDDMESELSDKDLATYLMSSKDNYSQGTSASSIRDIMEATLIPMPELPRKLLLTTNAPSSASKAPRIAGALFSDECELTISPPALEFCDIVPFPDKTQPNIQVVTVINTSTTITYRIRQPHLVDANMDLDDPWSGKGVDWCQCFVMGLNSTTKQSGGGDLSSWYPIPPGGCIRIGIQISFPPFTKDPYKSLDVVEAKRNEKERVMRAVLRVEFCVRGEQDGVGGLVGDRRPTLSALVKCVLARANIYASVDKLGKKIDEYELKLADAVIGERAARVVKLVNSSPVGTNALLRLKKKTGAFHIHFPGRDGTVREDVVWKGWIDGNSTVNLNVDCGPFDKKESYRADFQIEYHALDAWKTKLEPGITSLIRKPLTITVDAVDLPFQYESPDVDVKCLRNNSLYRTFLTVRNLSMSTEPFSLQIQNATHHELTGTDSVAYTIPNFGVIDITPVKGILHAGESINVWMKLFPKYDDSQDRLGDSPFELQLYLKSPKFNRFHVGRVFGSITSKRILVQPDVIDIGRLAMGEGKKLKITLSTMSRLGSTVGFINLPPYIRVLPTDAFIDLPPTIDKIIPVECDIEVAPIKTGKFQHRLLIKSTDGEEIALICKGEVLATPLNFQAVPGNAVHFGRVCVTDKVFSVGFPVKVVIENPASRQDAGDTPIAFEFAEAVGVWTESGLTWDWICGNDISKFENQKGFVRGPLKILPRSGILKPGEKRLVTVRFAPELMHFENPLKYTRPITPNSKTTIKPPVALAPRINSATNGNNASQETPPPAPKQVEISALPQVWRIPCFTKKAVEKATTSKAVMHLQVEATVLGPMIKVLDPPDAKLDFGRVPLLQLLEKTIIIKNLSDNPIRLKLSRLNPDGPFAIADGMEMEIDASETKTLTATFYAKQNDSFFEFLELYSTDKIQASKSILKLKLSGVGVQGNLSFDTPSMQVDLGNTIIGENSVKTFTVTNDSDVSLTGSVSLSPSSKFECWPMRIRLAPGEKQAITVKFSSEEEVPLYKDVIRLYIQSRKYSYRMNIVARCWASTAHISGYNDFFVYSNANTTSSNVPSKFLTFNEQVSKILLGGAPPLPVASAVSRLTFVEIVFPEVQAINVVNLRPSNVNINGVAWNPAAPLKSDSLIKSALDVKKVTNAGVTFELIPIPHPLSLPVEAVVQYAEKVKSSLKPQESGRGILLRPTKGTVELGSSTQLQISMYDSQKTRDNVVEKSSEAFFLLKLSGGLVVTKNREPDTLVGASAWGYSLIQPEIPQERLFVLRVIYK